MPNGLCQEEFFTLSGIFAIILAADAMTLGSDINISADAKRIDIEPNIDYHCLRGYRFEGIEAECDGRQGHLVAPSKTVKQQNGVTLADIASRCGISTYAVSQALRGGNGQVSEQTRLRVLATARELGYDPSRNQAARRLALQKHGTNVLNHVVGLLLPKQFGSGRYYSRLFHGITNAMMEEGYDTHVSVMNSKDMPIPMVCGRGEIDGLFVACSALWFVSTLWMERMRSEVNFGDKPIIGLIDPIPGCSSVHADDFRAGYLAMSHLLQLGHRHIFHPYTFDEVTEFNLVPPIGDVVQRRLAGIRQAYFEQGLSPDNYLHGVPMSTGDDCLMQPASLFAQAFAEHPEVTAMLVANDYVALHLLPVLAELGIRVPEDISIVSYDDTEPIVGLDGKNNLTTVRIPLADIGQEAAKLMLRSVGNKNGSLQEIVLQPELMVRNSTAPVDPRKLRD